MSEQKADWILSVAAVVVGSLVGELIIQRLRRRDGRNDAEAELARARARKAIAEANKAEAEARKAKADACRA